MVTKETKKQCQNITAVTKQKLFPLIKLKKKRLTTSKETLASCYKQLNPSWLLRVQGPDFRKMTKAKIIFKLAKNVIQCVAKTFLNWDQIKLAIQQLKLAQLLALFTFTFLN